MKKFIKPNKFACILLAAILCMSMFCFVGCGEPEKESPISPSLNHGNSAVSKSDIADIIGSDTDDKQENIPASDSDSIETPVTPVVSGELSSDPFSYQISIDGSVIQLPCSISEFEKLGWKMEDDKADNTLDEGYTTSVSLYNGDDYITASIYNDGEHALKYNETMVDDLYFSKYGVESHSITISNGLTLGSSKDDVIAIYGTDTSYEYVSDDGKYSTLEYEGENFLYKISFSFSDDVVIDIAVRTA